MTATPAGAAPSASRRERPLCRRAQWLSFQRTASANDARLSTPPPILTAYNSRVRRPGVVLRVCVIFARVPSTASTTRRVRVATPDRRCRKFNATRSPASSPRATPCTIASVAPRSTHDPSAITGVMTAAGSSSWNTVASRGPPATTNRPSAMKRASVVRPAAAPSNRVVTSSAARSSARARRTSTKPNGSANRQHPVDGPARAFGHSRGDGHVVLHVAERVTQLFQRDLLHVAALGGLPRRQEFLARILAPQAVQHARLRRYHKAPSG